MISRTLMKIKNDDTVKRNNTESDLDQREEMEQNTTQKEINN